MPDTNQILGLGSMRIANGGTEWFLTLDGQPVYANSDRVGVFTDERGVDAETMLPKVLRQWNHNLGVDGRELRVED
jgi:hypothetical protein